MSGFYQPISNMSEYIEIIGAETHNLKNVSVSIPKNRLVVITGLSGSGKSSLAFDTLYAEGQKRYLESLSTYARMVISNTSAATKVQEIRGLSPTIAIHQKTVSNSPRSTVGTITEIYDFYRLLFANIGVQHCPHHPHISLKKDTIQQIFEEILKQDEGRKIYICFPFVREGDVTYSQREIAEYVTQKGFVRFLMRDQVFSVADHTSDELVVDVEDVSIIVDRLITRRDDVGFETRLRDSLLLASEHGDGKIYIVFPDAHETRKYSLHNACILCDYESRDLTLSHFSFNSHYGACEDC